ncbi:MAG: DNA polymerase III subunit gamma/tau, partial [Phycisphaerae bacterium]
IGEDVDVVEIDAASHTGVDSIRELRSNATLRPSRSRFKVYIIDEVHMLSTSAFNALLKTLEEPPSHVKFILATTKSQKVPATVSSRCQRFDFHAIGAAAIAGHLAGILKREGVTADEAVVRRIARLANGSMRDALSLLDKLLSYESKHLSQAVVDELMPPPHDELAFRLVERLAEQDAAGALAALDEALQSGRTVDRFCDHLIEHVRTLMLLCVSGTDSDLVDVAGADRPRLGQQAARFDAPTYVYMITLLEELRRNVKFSGAARALADAAVVRLAMARQFSDVRELIERLEDGTAPERQVGGACGGGVNPGSDNSSKKNDRANPKGLNGSPAMGRGGSSTPPADAPRSVVSRDAVPRGRGTFSSAQWEAAVNDAFVQRVKESVNGTLTGIRKAQPVAVSPSGEASLSEQGSSDRG